MLQARDEAQLSESFGRLISQLREDDPRHLTQRAAAKLMGVSHTRLRSLEQGKHHVTGLPTLPSPDLVTRIAVVYRQPKATMLLRAGYLPWKLDDAQTQHLLDSMTAFD